MSNFNCPTCRFARGQGRSNSGIYLQRRYEMQILDSFALDGLANECGSVYRYRRPEINMCLPPLAWQTYDIDFRSARFDVSGKKTRRRASHRLAQRLRRSGASCHHSQNGPRRPEAPELLPIEFQNHGDPVRFRNIWLVVNSRAVGQYDSGLPFNSYQQPGSSVFDNVHLPQRYGFYWTPQLTAP